MSEFWTTLMSFMVRHSHTSSFMKNCFNRLRIYNQHSKIFSKSFPLAIILFVLDLEMHLVILKKIIS